MRHGQDHHVPILDRGEPFEVCGAGSDYPVTARNTSQLPGNEGPPSSRLNERQLGRCVGGRPS
jgi:hypothetical protein